MRFHELPGESVSLRVRCVGGSSFKKHFSRPEDRHDVLGLRASTQSYVFEVLVNGDLVEITPVEKSSAIEFAQKLNVGGSILAELADLAPDDSAVLRVNFFSGPIIEFGDIEVAVDEHVEQRLQEMLSRNILDSLSFLEETTSYVHGGESYFFAVVGPAVKDVLKAEFSNCDSPSVANSICLVANDFRFVITASSLLDGRRIFVPSRITTLRRGMDRAIRLARGRIRYADWKSAGEIRLRAKAALTSISTEQSSYLRKWDEYGQAEFDLFQKRAIAFGEIRYSVVDSTKDGFVIVRIEHASDRALDELDAPDRPDLDYVDQIPEFIANGGISFTEFESELIRRREAAGVVGATRSTKEEYLSKPLKVKRFVRETRTLEIDIETLPPSGLLIMSIRGDLAQMDRRQRARQAILEGRSANPQLGLLIEDKGELTSLRAPQRVKPLSAFVREKVFTAPPTPMQVRAIEVALNTPDIALIQGPPGTGKTTVIAAIVERLNELANQSALSLPGQILLSGFQHDAVENLINRLSVNGLPVPKFGRRQDAIEDDDTSAYEKNLADWCEALSEKLRTKYPQLAELQDEAEVRSLHLQYLKVPTQELGCQLLKRISRIGPRVLGSDLFREVNVALTEINEQQQVQDGRQKYLRAARGLRVKEHSFSDDGPDRAEDCMIALDPILDESQKSLLKRAADWRTSRGCPPFLEELRELKIAILRSLTERPFFFVQKHNDQLIRIAMSAVERIRENGLSAKDKEVSYLAEFLADIERNPSGIRHAVESFSFAYSATVQQSVNRQVQRKKGVDGDPEAPFISYKYVILDEAARISPRDLMVAMAQGEKIILVGDHRQLPHIVDEEVARQMESDAIDEIDLEQQWLERSMFEYLFSDRLKALEAVDGIQRRVTLDQQFRMHPILGDFISQNFYERFDSSEKFDSGLPAAEFEHNLAGASGRPAMWLDVPGSAGTARKQGTSWVRQAEADAIATQLLEWMRSDEGRELTFGVIAFYRAQAEVIRREVIKRMDDVEIDHKRLRIGTVDSFQGMEFDVVFLSVVRTGMAVPDVGMNRARDAQKLFGHLCLYNRVNVAMSRQKRLLVVVGDPALLESEVATEFIPSLVNFRSLAG